MSQVNNKFIWSHFPRFRAAVPFSEINSKASDMVETHVQSGLGFAYGVDMNTFAIQHGGQLGKSDVGYGPNYNFSFLYPKQLSTSNWWNVKSRVYGTKATSVSINYENSKTNLSAGFTAMKEGVQPEFSWYQNIYNKLFSLKVNIGNCALGIGYSTLISENLTMGAEIQLDQRGSLKQIYKLHEENVKEHKTNCLTLSVGESTSVISASHTRKLNPKIDLLLGLSANIKSQTIFKPYGKFGLAISPEYLGHRFFKITRLVTSFDSNNRGNLGLFVSLDPSFEIGFSGTVDFVERKFDYGLQINLSV